MIWERTGWKNGWVGGFGKPVDTRRNRNGNGNGNGELGGVDGGLVVYRWMR